MSIHVDPRLAFGDPPSPELLETAGQCATRCIECNICVRRCAFLTEAGTPKSIAESVLAGPGPSDTLRADPYHCSLCGLCGALCPVDLQPEEMLLSMRRQAVQRGALQERAYSKILSYQRLGSSELFSLDAFPPGCDTVFFSGCTLPGTRPTTATRLFELLREDIPDIGVMLACCGKPSHDLGMQDRFESVFGQVIKRLRARGVHRVVTACPNCDKVFNRYGNEFETQPIWRRLAEKGREYAGWAGTAAGRTVAVHDPCPARNDEETQTALRDLIKGAGCAIAEMPSARRATLCCGEGGSVGFVRPEFAETWRNLRLREAADLPVVTSCAGCAGCLGRGKTDVVHIGDLLCRPQKAFCGGKTAAGSLLAHLNRLRLKNRFKKMVPRRQSA